MWKFIKEFVFPDDSHHHFNFKFQVGKHIASSLSGFIAGVIFASIIWIICVYFLKVL